MLHVICDNYSNFIEVESIANTTTGRVTMALVTQFTRYSVPDTVVFDNEPHFSSKKFAIFIANYISLIMLYALIFCPCVIRSDKILIGFTRASTFITDIHTPGPEKAIH